MKTFLHQANDHGIKHQRLMFVCPGCIAINPESTGLHSIAVNSTEIRPSWTFDGNLELPTLSPSILTRHGDDKVCHSFLRAGVFEFLGDCTHNLAGQSVLIPDMPTWESTDDQ